MQSGRVPYTLVQGPQGRGPGPLSSQFEVGNSQPSQRRPRRLLEAWSGGGSSPEQGGQRGGAAGAQGRCRHGLPHQSGGPPGPRTWPPLTATPAARETLSVLSSLLSGRNALCTERRCMDSGSPCGHCTHNHGCERGCWCDEQLLIAARLAHAPENRGTLSDRRGDIQR